MCAKVPKAINRQDNNSADESMTGRKLKTTMALDSLVSIMLNIWVEF